MMLGSFTGSPPWRRKKTAAPAAGTPSHVNLPSTGYKLLVPHEEHKSESAAAREKRFFLIAQYLRMRSLRSGLRAGVVGAPADRPHCGKLPTAN